MDRVKGNTGALLLFIGTIIITISTALGLILGILGIGAAGEVAATAITEAGGSAQDAELARTVAVVTFVIVLALSAVINLLVIIPGFKYSMKGTCKTWAFVMAIIGIISVVASLFNIANSPSSIVSTLVGAAGIILYIIGVFMLRKKEA